MSVEKKVVIREYVKAIQEGNAAVFGGAGLSRSSGCVDWKGLLEPLAEDIGLDSKRENDLILLAQFYANKIGNRGIINQTIIDAFDKDIEINENIEILTRLPIEVYWTTNYDKLIEDGIRLANRNPDVKYKQDQFSYYKRDRDAIVYKMHGDVEDPMSAVLIKDDYETFSKSRPLFRTALQGDLVSKKFLFVGFSFEDPNLEYILTQIRLLLDKNVQNHYCFFRRVQSGDYPTPEDDFYNMAKQELRADDLKRYGIQVCFIDSYEEITEILREIEKLVKMKDIFISGSVEDYKDGWTDDIVWSFTNMLAKKLVKKNYRITSGYGLGIGSPIINGALEEIYASKYRHTGEHLRMRPFPRGFKDDAERKRKYRKYREDMISEVGIAIFLFGNKTEILSDGSKKIVLADGCREEFEIAKSLGKIVIPIGCTGDVAKEAYDDVKANPSKYKYLSGYFDKLNDKSNLDALIETIIDIIEKQQV